MKDDSRPTSVYRYYDVLGSLIYVGVTSRGLSRNLEHAMDKEWWPYVYSQAVDHHDTRADALAAEKALIRSHRPPFNKHHNVDHEELRTAYLKRDMPPVGKELLTAKYISATHGRRLPLHIVQQTDHLLLMSTLPEHEKFVERLTWNTQLKVSYNGGNSKFPNGKLQQTRPGCAVAVVELRDPVPLIISAYARVKFAQSNRPDGASVARLLLESETPAEQGAA